MFSEFCIVFWQQSWTLPTKLSWIIILSYGSDRTLKPWKDVIQYNYWEPKTVEVMKDNLKKVLILADAVRCDRAYLILNDVSVYLGNMN